MTGPIPDRYKRWLEVAFTIAAIAGVIALIAARYQCGFVPFAHARNPIRRNSAVCRGSA